MSTTPYIKMPLDAPEITAIVPEGMTAVDFVASAMGYPLTVSKTPEELPALETVEVEDEANPGSTYTVEQYPEGTELNKPNDEPKEVFIAREANARWVSKGMAALIADAKRQAIKVAKEAEMKAVEDEEKQLASVFNSVAQVGSE